jgi:hypothetical protein
LDLHDHAWDKGVFVDGGSVVISGLPDSAHGLLCSASGVERVTVNVVSLEFGSTSNDVAEAERITLRNAFWQQRAIESGVHIVFRLSFVSAFGLINRVLSGGIS